MSSSGTNTVVDPLLVSQIEDSVVCEWGEIESEFEDCPDAARWIIYIRDVCGHGSPIPGDDDLLLCEFHKGRFLYLFRSGASVQCRACGCYMEAAHHLIREIRRL